VVLISNQISGDFDDFKLEEKLKSICAHSVNILSGPKPSGSIRVSGDNKELPTPPITKFDHACVYDNVTLVVIYHIRISHSGRFPTTEHSG